MTPIAHTVGADDMVAYLLADVAAGAEISLQGAATGAVTAQDAISVFHKIALRPIRAGETVWRIGMIEAASGPARVALSGLEF